MPEFPFGVHVEARVSQFSAICAVILLLIFAIFLVACFVLDEGQLRSALIIVSVIGFFAFAISIVYIGVKWPNRFATRLEYRHVFEFPRLKRVGEEPVTTAAELSQPVAPPQIEEPAEDQELVE